MGSLLWREDGRRLVVQWYDALGKLKQETVRSRSLDGAPLARRTLERDGRRRLAEHELEVDRQRAGLASISSAVLKHDLAWLLTWWWKARGSMLKSPDIKPFLEKHLKELLDQPLGFITASRVSRLLEEKAEQLSPKSRKHLRGYLFGIFELARRPGGPWHGRTNPIEDVPPIKVPKVPRYILQPHEMQPVIDLVDDPWKGPVAVALFAGLREGEVFGLLKRDVDLVAGVIMVWRSWDAARTKDAKALPVPVAAALVPYLEEALKSRGELVFPQADGTMHPTSLRLGKVLRRAVAAAGLVTGWEWRCRAWRCGWKERRPSKAVPAECPKCHHLTTWAKAVPRHVRFHDTRHSFGTQLVRAAGLAVAQQGLRHSDSRLTADTYGHLELEDLRQGMLVAFPATERRLDPSASPSGATGPQAARAAVKPEVQVQPAAPLPSETTAGRLQDSVVGGKKKARIR